MLLKPRKRITKQVLKEDKLVTYTFKLNSYVRDNLRKIGYIVLGFCLVLFITLSLFYSGKRSETNAMADVGIAELLYDSGNIEMARNAFEDVVKNYKRTKGAGMAVYYVGDCYYSLRKFEEAKKYFQMYIDDYGNNNILKSSAISGIAGCFEEEGKYEQAAEYYKKSAEEFPDSFNAPRNLIDMARCYEIIGKKEEAKNGYKKVIEKYASSAYVREASIMLDLL